MFMLSCNQEMFMGKSPLCTEHWTDRKSSVLMGSSPKSNGTIWGGTVIIKWGEHTV